MSTGSRTPARYATTVVALDPGKATGYAVCSIYRGAVAEGGITHPVLGDRWLQVHTSGTLDFEETPALLPEIIDRALAGHRFRAIDDDVPRPMPVICEHFTLTTTAVQGQSTWSLEVIGMARYIVAHSDGRMVLDTSQQPSSMKNLVHKNKVLEACGLTRKTTPHERDALGHAFLFATRVGR